MNSTLHSFDRPHLRLVAVNDNPISASRMIGTKEARAFAFAIAFGIGFWSIVGLIGYSYFY